jgi:hypothetical protein
MSHEHLCGVTGHRWLCDSHDCECICGVPMHVGDHSGCPLELRTCPKHAKAPAVPKRTRSSAVPIKAPPQRTLRLALRRASRRRNCGAYCLWCGHGYPVGEYTPEAADAHLLQCPNYPEEGKQVIRKSRQRDRARRTHAK